MENSNQPTIAELRRSGHKVRVIHKDIENDDPYAEIAHTLTSIDILDPQGNEWHGEARCSNKDQYNRKLGNKIALHRALKLMNKFYLNKTISHATIPSII